MKVINNIVKADSGKYLKYKSELASEFTLGKKFVCIDGITTLQTIKLEDIKEVQLVRIKDLDCYISANNYEQAVTELIRQKYTLDQELALHANLFKVVNGFLIPSNEKNKEFVEFENWRQICKQTAKKIFNE